MFYAQSTVTGTVISTQLGSEESLIQEHQMKRVIRGSGSLKLACRTESRIWKLSGGYPWAKFERSSQLHRLQLMKRQALQCSPTQTNKIFIATQTPRTFNASQWTKTKTKHLHDQLKMKYSLGKWFQADSQMVDITLVVIITSGGGMYFFPQGLWGRSGESHPGCVCFKWRSGCTH